MGGPSTLAMTQTETSTESTSTSSGFTLDSFEIMIFVSISCNFFTIILSMVVMYKLIRENLRAKKNAELKRKRLYTYSCLFVSTIFV